MEEQSSASHLAVIGASAGGVEALTEFVATLPAPFPAPIVIAQHLQPSYTSHLQSILERVSTIPVRTVTDNARLENGVVYVVPSNRDVEISDHEVRLRDEGEGRPKPSVDLLFRSAAEAFGEELIAVILTGTGSDGADGARVVKEHGGTVIIQNPQTASHPGMPLSLAPSIVDISADLKAIGPLLHDIITGAYTPPPPEQNREMHALLEQLRQQSGIDFSQYRQSTIQRRLQRRMADTGAAGINAYLRYLQRHPEEYERLVATFLIKVTDFFRDSELFDYLRETVLPDLIERARSHGNELRLWSAGCATGEEAYSLAILVADLLGDELPDFTVRIFATDVDTEAVAFARRGVYPTSSLQDVPERIVERYFSSVDGAYEIHKNVRALLVFGQHDLGQRAPFPRTDLVLCRNVLIYFTPELQRRALQLFAFSLQPGGRLVLGKSETTNPLPEYLALEQPRLRVYRRQGERILIPPGAEAGAFSAQQQTIQVRAVQLGRQRLQLRAPALQFDRFERPAPDKPDVTLLNLQSGVVVIDDHYDILHINLAARRLFGIHGTAVGEDFVHLARSIASERLLTLIDAARRGERPREILQVRSVEAEPDNLRSLQIHSYRQIVEGEDGENAPVVVEVTDISDLVREHERAAAELRDERDRLAEESAQYLEDAARLSTLLREVQQTVTRLLADNEELGRNNGLLRSQNEELLVGTEEAQAAADEVETLNEEQQATNEELETLNEELQATIEELRATNEDLEARSTELQDLAAAREMARARLAAILSSMADAAVAVDRDGRPVLSNAAFERLFGPDGASLQPEDEDGQPLKPEDSPQQRAARGEQFTMQFTNRDAEGNRRWFEAVGQPVEHGITEAGMVTIRDITERNLRRLQGQFVAAAAHELRTPLTVLEGSLQMLERRGGALPPEQSRQYLGMALHELERLRALTEELVDVERLELGQLQLARESVDLAEVVRQSVNAAQSLAEAQTIVLAPFDGSLLVSGDRMRLEQVFLNLLTNAVNHAPVSERIDVRLARVDAQAQVEVQDYGPGIAPEDLPHIFDRFYQVERTTGARNTGLGLGLFICHEIVVAHGGTIDVRSEPGQGATFTVRLPVDGS
jgi:two-component system CheB/CheR fusion protein